MGRAVFEAISQHIPQNNLHILSTSHKDFSKHSYTHISQIHDLTFDVIFLAFKPQQLHTISQEINTHLQQISNSSTTFISMLAATNLNTIAKTLSIPPSQTIRIMPNLGIKANQGITIAYTQNPALQTLLTTLLQHSTILNFVQNEHEIEAHTVLSSCMLGFLYHTFSSIESATKTLNLNPQYTFLDILTSTLAYAQTQSNHSFNTLASAVASKGGLTEAGIQSLKQTNLQQIFTKAISTAIKHADDMKKDN